MKILHSKKARSKICESQISNNRNYLHLKEDIKIENNSTVIDIKIENPFNVKYLIYKSKNRI